MTNGSRMARSECENPWRRGVWQPCGMHLPAVCRRESNGQMPPLLYLAAVEGSRGSACRRRVERGRFLPGLLRCLESGGARLLPRPVNLHLL